MVSSRIRTVVSGRRETVDVSCFAVVSVSLAVTPAEAKALFVGDNDVMLYTA